MNARAENRALVRREERRRTVLPARVRSGSRWVDGCILNISSRGLLIHAQAAAEPGSYIEIRRGRQIVHARVIWRSNSRIGLCSPELLPVEDIISTALAAAAAPTIGESAHVERRTQRRDPAQSRHRGRAMQFAFAVVIGASLAVGLGAFVMETFARPVMAVQSALGAR